MPKRDCLINGRPATLDEAARYAAELVAAGVKFEVLVAPCRKCGSTERYRSNPSPSWMNRWTCPKCGRHESR